MGLGGSLTMFAHCYSMIMLTVAVVMKNNSQRCCTTRWHKPHGCGWWRLMMMMMITNYIHVLAAFVYNSQTNCTCEAQFWSHQHLGLNLWILMSDLAPNMGGQDDIQQFATFTHRAHWMDFAWPIADHWYTLIYNPLSHPNQIISLTPAMIGLFQISSSQSESCTHWIDQQVKRKWLSLHQLNKATQRSFCLFYFFEKWNKRKEKRHRLETLGRIMC